MDTRLCCLIISICITGTHASLHPHLNRTTNLRAEHRRVSGLYRDCLHSLLGRYSGRQENLIILNRRRDVVNGQLFTAPTYSLNGDLWRIFGRTIPQQGTSLATTHLAIPTVLSRLPWSDVSRFIIVGTDEAEATHIFRDLWEERIINVVALVPAGNSIKILTYYPYTTKACSTVQPVTLAMWNRTSAVTLDLFPDKVSDLKQCPLWITLLDRPPFVKFAKDGSASGVEVEILKAVSESMNAKPVFQFLHTKPWMRTIKDPSLNTLMLDLTERHGDIAAGSLMYVRSVSFVSVGIDYSESLCVTFAVPQTSSRSISVVAFFKSRKSVGLMIVFGLTLFVLCWFFYKLKKFPNPIQRAINVVASPLAGTILTAPRQSTLRITIAIWLWYVFIFWKTFEAFLSSHVLAPQASPNLETMSDVLNTNLTIVGETFLMSEILTRYADEGRLATFGRYRIGFEKVINDIAKGRNMAYLGTKPTLWHILMEHPEIHDLIYIQKSCATEYSPVVQISKGSPLTGELTKRVKALSEFGIVRGLMKRTRDESAREYDQHLPDYSYKPLVLKDVASGIVVLITGLLASLIAFVLEVISGRCVSRLKRLWG